MVGRCGLVVAVEVMFEVVMTSVEVFLSEITEAGEALTLSLSFLIFILHNCIMRGTHGWMLARVNGRRMDYYQLLLDSLPSHGGDISARMMLLSMMI